MSTLSEVEAKSLFGALLLFLGGKSLWEFDCVNIHSIGVFGCSGGRKGLESLSRPSTSLRNLFCSVPLILTMGGFRVPVINFIWNCIKGHDLLHEQSRDSSSREANKDIVVHDAIMSSVALEH